MPETVIKSFIRGNRIVANCHTNLLSTSGTEVIKENESISSSTKKIDDDEVFLQTSKENTIRKFDDDSTKHLGILAWYRKVCDALPGFKEQAERFIDNQMTGNVRDPAAVRMERLKGIRSGHESDFEYIAPLTPEEIEAEQIEEEKRLERLEAEREETEEREMLRDKKHREALNLFNNLDPDDMAMIGIGLEALRSQNERVDYLIEQTQRMEEMQRV